MKHGLLYILNMRETVLNVPSKLFIYLKIFVPLHEN
jgi:hypothetical protein